MLSFESPRLVQTTVVATLALLAGACSVPSFEGAQIQDPPAGFLLQNDSYQNRRMFPDRPTLMHSAWIEAGNGPYSGIYINAHEGEITLEEIMAAREAGMAAAEHPETGFGEVEAMTIDGRNAWGWSERLETPTLGLDWVAYRTVVAYDTISYAIEFYSGDPGIKITAPDTLKTVISSFAIGRTEWNLPLIAILFGGTLLAVSVARTKSKERQERLASINLVKFEVPKEDEDPSGEGGPTAPAPPASPSAIAPERQSPPKPPPPPQAKPRDST